MDETTELLRAALNRTQEIMGEVNDLRYKVKEVRGDVDALRSVKEQNGRGEQGGQDGRRPDGEQREHGGHSPSGSSEGAGSGDLEQRVAAVEEQLEFFGRKWLEHDMELFKLRKPKEK